MIVEPLAISAASLRRFIRDAFVTTGMAQGDAQTAADALATADEFGVATHGVKLLPGYLRRLNAGGIRPAGQPRVLAEGPAWALVDGDAVLGALAGVFAMRLAVAKAGAAGIAYVGVRNGSHFGAVGYYALLAARAGLVGIVACNDTPSVVAPGAMRAVLGTNPFSYAIPAQKHPPILFDGATSTVAGGKVFQARQLGQLIPGDWIVGLDGLPTNDATLYPEKAALVSFGGYKGFGLSLLVESLAGLLSGAAVTFGVRAWMLVSPDQATHHGAAFIAIDPAVWGVRDGFLARVDTLIDEIHATPVVAGVQRVVVPGEREFEHQRQAQTEPLTFQPDVAQSLQLAAQIAGLALVDYQTADESLT